MAGAGPEYESVSSLGSYCLVSDLEAVCLANDLCNRYGLDTISTGAAVAFGMEAYEQGAIGSEDLGGASLAWGDPEAMLATVRSIGEGTGIGALLGRGVRTAAHKLGGRAAECSLHVKGLELPAHDPRAFFSSALSYATSNRGACHLAGFTHGLESSMTMPELGYTEIQDRFGLQGKGEMVALMQNLMGVVDSLKVCKFILGAIRIADLLDCYRMVTGYRLDQQELLKAGERIFNLKRLYNVAHGLSRKDDCLPARVLTWPRQRGGAAGQLPHLGRMLADYYACRGWDEMGIPTRETVERLGLGWMRRNAA
jgi:aldehyde:ferredoxin oxidoreductase